MNVEANMLSIEAQTAAEREFEGAVDLLAQDDALPPEGALADGPRPKRRFNARTRRHELVKPDARKARNKAQRQARKRSRGS